MAKEVNFREFTPRNSRDDIIRRVEHAPIDHAEALLASYDLLQRLYDKGIIDLFNGLLSAGDTIAERVSDVVSSRESVNTLRIGLILGNLVTSIEPDRLQTVISKAEDAEPPSLMSIIKQASSKEARRGIATAVGLLNVLGEALNAQHTKR